MRAAGDAEQQQQQRDRAFTRLANLVLHPELARILADAYAARAETRYALDCFLSEHHPLSSQALEVLSTPELCTHIFTFLGEARDLLSAAAVCKTWRQAEVADTVWQLLVEQDFPMVDVADFDVSARSRTLMGDAFCEAVFDTGGRPMPRMLYRGLAQGMDFRVHVFHRDLKGGNFGAAMWNRACYGGRLGTNDGLGRVITRRLYTVSAPSSVTNRPATLAFIPERRVRRPPSDCSEAFKPMAETFHSLSPGMVVEVQWKGKVDAPRFNHWFALVHAVLADGETVELLFPQYGSNAAGATLTDLAAVRRSAETPMHGGFAGGIRIPSAEDVQRWWELLMEDKHDFHTPSDETACLRICGHQIAHHGHTVTLGEPSPLLRHRATFERFLPEGQPFRSMQLAKQVEAKARAGGEAATVS